MSPPLRPISENELEVLKVLWTVGPATVRDVQESLRTRRRDVAYNTVQTFLLRLQEKGYVRSERGEARAHVFRAAVTRETYLGDRLSDLADRVGEPAALPLLMSLAQGRRFSPEEIRQLRRLLDEMEAGAAAAKSRGRGGRRQE